MTPSDPSAARPSPSSGEPGDERSLYDGYFWLMYAGNFAAVAANAVTFKFAEFVAFLDGAETIAGWLVSVGLCGAVLLRYAFAQELDRFGYRRVWGVGAGLLLLGAVLQASAGSLGPWLYAARLCFSCGLAIVFACGNAHIQMRAPEHRRTEAIAMIGSSGFLGLMFGILLGDAIFAGTVDDFFRYRLLFGVSAVLAAAHLAISLVVTRRDGRPTDRAVRPALSLLREYWPGACLLPGVMMGVGFGCTSVFLTRFATERGFEKIGPFFFGYAITAFLTRMVSRDWPARFGRRRLILAGCASQTIGFSLFPTVAANWMLVIPAVGIGFGHAVLFPSVVSIGSGRFPKAYRGTGTLLTMGIFDIGFLASAPVEGWIAESLGFSPLFLSVAAGFFVAGIGYGLLSAGEYDAEYDPGLASRSPIRLPLLASMARR